MRRTVPLLLAFVALMLGSLGAPSAGASQVRDGGAAAPIPRIVIVAFTYVPDPVVVRPGAGVTVLNADDAVVRLIPGHSVTADNGSFNTGVFFRFASFRAPSRPGIFRFHCLVHSFMHGVLIVR